MKRIVAVSLLVIILGMLVAIPAMPISAQVEGKFELIESRTVNSKTFQLEDGKRQLRVSTGVVHYKNDYTSDEPWKDIDLTWEGNRITKAPYELTLDGNKITLRDKKSGEVSTIELIEIGGKVLPEILKAGEKEGNVVTIKDIALDTDFEIVAEYGRVRFARVLKSAQAPAEAKFRVTGKIPFMVHAEDASFELPMRELPVEATLKDGILTETLQLDRPVKYPVRIDPTWQVGANTDDCHRALAPDEFDLAAIRLVVGALGAANFQYGCGMRFTNITIPQGSTIASAYLILTCETAQAQANVESRISAEDVDDAVTFADNAGAFDARWAARTAARVDWDNIAAWVKDTEYNSPECRTIEQELVDRVGWVSGQDQVWFWDDFEDRNAHAANQWRFAYSHNGDNAKAAQLVITFTPPIPPPTTTGDPRDPDLFYLEIRPDLDETRMVKKAFIPAPYDIDPGVFTGYLLHIWAEDDEELYFSVCVPDRWDEENDIIVHIDSALELAGEVNNAYQLHLEWENVTPNEEVVPIFTVSHNVPREDLSNLQYFCYRDWFVIDYDIPVAGPIVSDDILSFRLQRVTVEPEDSDLTGGLIILHAGVLFSRGDLLCNPDNIITEEDMEEIGIQFGVFNTILEGWNAFFLIAFGLVFIIGLSFLAFWRFNALIFMLTAGASLIFGFFWYDAFTTNLGLTLGLMMIAYALVCIGFAFRCIFWREYGKEE